MKKRIFLYGGILLAGIALGVFFFFQTAYGRDYPVSWYHYTLSDPIIERCAPPEGFSPELAEDRAFYILTVTLTNDGRTEMYAPSFVPGYLQAPSGLYARLTELLLPETPENALYLDAFSSRLPAGASVRCRILAAASKELTSCTLYYDPYDMYNMENGGAALTISFS